MTDGVISEERHIPILLLNVGIDCASITRKEIRKKGGRLARNVCSRTKNKQQFHFYNNK